MPKIFPAKIFFKGEQLYSFSVLVPTMTRLYAIGWAKFYKNNDIDEFQTSDVRLLFNIDLSSISSLFSNVIHFFGDKFFVCRNKNDFSTKSYLFSIDFHGRITIIPTGKYKNCNFENILESTILEKSNLFIFAEFDIKLDKFSRGWILEISIMKDGISKNKFIKTIQKNNFK